jgi:hypothetical protein
MDAVSAARLMRELLPILTARGRNDVARMAANLSHLVSAIEDARVAKLTNVNARVVATRIVGTRQICWFCDQLDQTSEADWRLILRRHELVFLVEPDTKRFCVEDCWRLSAREFGYLADADREVRLVLDMRSNVRWVKDGRIDAELPTLAKSCPCITNARRGVRVGRGATAFT